MKHAEISVDYQIRPAQLADIPDILALFASEVEAGRMLPRKKEDLASYFRCSNAPDENRLNLIVRGNPPVRPPFQDSLRVFRQ